MKKGIIIYAPEDVEKNRRFVKVCSDIMKESGVELKLVVLNDKSQNSIDKLINIEELSFAINRSRNAEIARQLEAAGVRVFNNSNITEIANDKWKTYKYVKDRGLPAMETCQGGQLVDCGFPYPRVIKSCAGHGGSEVFLVKNKEEEKEAIESINAPYIVQKLAAAQGRDVRVYVLGDDIVVSMRRSAVTGFKSNFSLGGSAERYQLNETEISIVKRLVEAMRPDYIGIDFIYDGDTVVLNEIEDAVGARMVYENTDIPIIERYAEYIVHKLCKSQ